MRIAYIDFIWERNAVGGDSCALRRRKFISFFSFDKRDDSRERKRSGNELIAESEIGRQLLRSMTHDDYVQTLTTARQQIDIAPLPDELGGFRVGCCRRTCFGSFDRVLIYCPARLGRCSIEKTYWPGMIRSEIKKELSNVRIIELTNNFGSFRTNSRNDWNNLALTSDFNHRKSF